MIHCLELISGMKIIFTKSCLVGTNSKPQDYGDMVNDLNCQIRKFALITLVSLSEDPQDQGTFGSSFRKMQKETSMFERKITSLLVAELSLSKQHYPTFRFTISHFRISRKGSSWNRTITKPVPMKRKIWSWTAFYKMEIVSRAKGNGGLDLGGILERNVALLGKWHWQFPKEKNHYGHQSLEANMGMTKTVGTSRIFGNSPTGALGKEFPK